MLLASAAQARGAVELAGGDARAAARLLRRASGLWLELEAPYEAARARLLVAAGVPVDGRRRDAPSWSSRRRAPSSRGWARGPASRPAAGTA